MTLYFGDLACLFCKQCRFPKDAAECRFGLETKAGEKKQKTGGKEPAKKQPSTVSASASALHASLAQQCEELLWPFALPPYAHPAARMQETPVLVQVELAAELEKKKARAARFNMPVKTNAEEVRSWV